MEIMEPLQNILFEGVSENQRVTYLSNPIKVYRWVCYKSGDSPVSLSGNNIIGIKTLLIDKPMGLESPSIFNMCHEGVKISNVKFVQENGPNKMTLNLENVRISSATLKGQALISKYGKETIHLGFEGISLSKLKFKYK